MSDNAILDICMTVLGLGVLAFLGFLLWMGIGHDDGAHGIQPDKRPERIIAPKGGTGTYRPQGKPVDLRKATPPRQPSAVRIPRGGLPPKQGDA